MRKDVVTTYTLGKDELLKKVLGDAYDRVSFGDPRSYGSNGDPGYKYAVSFDGLHMTIVYKD